MESKQQFGKFNLFRSIQSTHRSRLNRLPDSAIHIRVTIAQNTGSNTHKAHIDKTATVEVFYFNTFGARIIRRPKFWREEFRPF
jgi:hypothetical protein